MRDLGALRFVDHPGNPLVEPPRPDWMIADPTVLPPDRTPDGRWHLYANSVGFLRHLVSDDGISWHYNGGRLFAGIRPFLFAEDGRYHLLYERFLRPWHSGIALRSSTDLVHWSAPRTLLAAERGPTDGRLARYLGNPCLLKVDGEYRLYFSSGWVFLTDCLYIEPTHVGLATAPSLDGPWRRDPTPLLAPSPGDPWRTLGAGSVKVLPDGEGAFWVFNNGIYRDPAGRSRSAILLLRSSDGRRLEPVGPTPIVAPEPGWKRAFVYAFDPVVWNGELRLYYNARDGWLRGAERIGLACARLRGSCDTPQVAP